VTKERDREPTAEQMAMRILMHLAALYDEIESAAMSGKAHPAMICAPTGKLITADGAPNRISVVAVQVAPIVLRDARAAMRKFAARRAAQHADPVVPS